MNGSKPHAELKYFDFKHFPKRFSSPHEALDAYNSLGWQHCLQFEATVKSPTSFSLKCPFAKMCPVQVNFNWQADQLKFVRAASFPIFHDHCLQLLDLSGVPPELQKQAQKYIQESDSKITPSQLCIRLKDKIKPYEAVTLLKQSEDTGKSEFTEASTQDSATASSILCQLDGGLKNDLQVLKDSNPQAHVKIGVSPSTGPILFIQTPDQMDLYKRNAEAGVLVTTFPRVSNPYNMT